MIAIIPARGGSKGLPGKNIKELLGKPLIAYTIDAALGAKCVNRIIVSTDDQTIAQIAEKYNAEVPFMRPLELAADDSKAIDSYLYTIERIEKNEQININSILILLPTCPLRTSEDIDNAYSIFIEKDADSVISYTKEDHPIIWHKYIENSGKFTDIFNENALDNRQSNRESFYPNGALYFFKKELLKQNKYYSDRSFAYIMPRERSVDIDDQNDFQYAEYLLKQNFINL